MYYEIYFKLIVHYSKDVSKNKNNNNNRNASHLQFIFYRLFTFEIIRFII